MSQMENMAVPAMGNMSKEELLELKKQIMASQTAILSAQNQFEHAVSSFVVWDVLPLL